MAGNNEIVQIEPKILEWARTRINMSLFEAAEILKKDEETIKKWEQGIAQPTLAQLEKLAYTAYKIPLAVFYLPEPPEESPLKRQFRTIPDNEILSLPYELMLSIKEGQYYQEVLKELFYDKNPAHSPIFKKYSELKLNDTIKIAQSIRIDLNINKSIQSDFKNTAEAFKYYREKIEKKGVFVFQQTLKNYCRGYSLYDKEFPIVVINSSELSGAGKNFTLFHELSHLLLNMGGLTNDFTYRSNDKEEIFCNKLAANILVDNNELLSDIHVKSNKSLEWDDEVLQLLAGKFKVSKEVILRKLLDMNLTTNSFYSSKREEWLEQFPQKRKGGGNFYKNRLSKLGNNYINAVLSSLYNGRINSYQASEYLNIKINQIPEIEKLVFE
ncbi:MAG: ImmA/IrrE family metallo-endopeptidase [Candidatus Kapaibacterium sp.]